jgi:hypothetical protein
MRTNNVKLALAFALVVLPFARSHAQTDQEKRAIQYISNIHNTFRQIIAHETGAGKQTEFLLRMPGLAIDPKMNMSNEDARLAFFRILDKRPLGDLSGQTSEEQLSGIYRELLYDTEATVKPDPAEIAKLEAAIKKIDDELVDPTSTKDHPKGIIAQYQKYDADYQNALKAYNTAILEEQTGTGNKGTDIGEKRSAKDIAESFLDNPNAGKRDLYRTKQAEQDDLRFALGKLDPFSYRRKVFTTWLEAKGPPPIPRILFYPPLSQWADDSGFSHLNFSSEILHKHEGTRTVNHESSGGWFVFKGHGGGSYSKTFSESQLDNLSIEMDIKQVVLDHIWMDRTVFSATNWKWKTPGAPNTPAAENQVISEGGPRADGLYYGRLPLLPVGLVIGRNIKIHIQLDKKTAEDVKKQIDAGGGGSFLGFSFGTSTSWSNTDKSNFGDVSEAGFEIKAPTIIGYICEIIPKCPAAPATPQ